MNKCIKKQKKKFKQIFCANFFFGNLKLPIGDWSGFVYTTCEYKQINTSKTILFDINCYCWLDELHCYSLMFFIMFIILAYIFFF